MVELLRHRGLEIENPQRVSYYIRNIGYYRLSAYMFPFLRQPKDEHRFKQGSKFQDALNLYRFDKKLRLFLFNEIEKGRDCSSQHSCKPCCWGDWQYILDDRRDLVCQSWQVQTNHGIGGQGTEELERGIRTSFQGKVQQPLSSCMDSRWDTSTRRCYTHVWKLGW